MIKYVFIGTCITVIYATICGCFTRMAIEHFKKEDYFTFGTALALAIGVIVNIVKYIWFH